MLRAVYYYINERGRNPVREFVDGLPVKEQAKIFAYIGELKNQGHNLRRPMADYLGNGIYELRPRMNRIFYFFFLKDTAVLLHVVRKKTKAISVADLDICIKRKTLVEMGRQIEKVESGGEQDDKG